PVLSPVLFTYPTLSFHVLFFVFSSTVTTYLYILSLHDALPISRPSPGRPPWTSPATGSPRNRTSNRFGRRRSCSPRPAGPCSTSAGERSVPARPRSCCGSSTSPARPPSPP